MGDELRLRLPPPAMVWLTPRSSSMPPRVTMNGCKSSRVISSPCSSPMAAATTSTSGIATHSDQV